MLSPTDATSQEPVVGSAQRVVVARPRAPRDAAVQNCLDCTTIVLFVKGFWCPCMTINLRAVLNGPNFLQNKKRGFAKKGAHLEND